MRKPHLFGEKNRAVSIKRKILVWSLVAVATLLLVISSITVWTKRQILDTNNYTKTAGSILENDEVRAALSAKLVNLLFSRVDVSSALQERLPEQLKPAAPVLAGALQNVAPRAANLVLGTAAAQTLWEEANRRMHTQLVAVLKGENVRNLTTANGDVVLDLRPLIQRVAARLGIEDRLKANASPTTGEIVILHSDQLEAVQKAVRVIKVLSIFIVIAVLLLYGLALFLARPSRRLVLGGIGGCIFVVGLLLLILQRILGNAIVDSVVKTDANKPAVREVWVIVTTELREIGIALVVWGLIAIIGAVLAGPNRVGTTVRRWLAPGFRRSVYAVYGVVVAIFLILLAWQPLGSDRSLIGTLVLAALVLWGIELLRRQTLREFPEEPPVVTPPATRPS
jgi:hypothetical protein